MTQRFRTGRKLGRSVYIQLDAEPAWGDVIIGFMDTPALGELVCIALNRLAELDPEIVETAVQAVRRARENQKVERPPDQSDQRSVDPRDTGCAVMPVEKEH